MKTFIRSDPKSFREPALPTSWRNLRGHFNLENDRVALVIEHLTELDSTISGSSLVLKTILA